MTSEKDLILWPFIFRWCCGVCGTAFPSEALCRAHTEGLFEEWGEEPEDHTGESYYCEERTEPFLIDDASRGRRIPFAPWPKQEEYLAGHAMVWPKRRGGKTTAILIKAAIAAWAGASVLVVVRSYAEVKRCTKLLAAMKIGPMRKEIIGDLRLKDGGAILITTKERGGRGLGDGRPCRPWWQRETFDLVLADRHVHLWKVQ